MASKKPPLPQAILVALSTGLFSTSLMQMYYYLVLPAYKGRIEYRAIGLNQPTVAFKENTWAYDSSSPTVTPHDLHYYISHGKALWMSSTPPNTSKEEKKEN